MIAHFSTYRLPFLPASLRPTLPASLPSSMCPSVPLPLQISREFSFLFFVCQLSIQDPCQKISGDVQLFCPYAFPASGFLWFSPIFVPEPCLCQLSLKCGVCFIVALNSAQIYLVQLYIPHSAMTDAFIFLYLLLGLLN